MEKRKSRLRLPTRTSNVTDKMGEHSTNKNIMQLSTFLCSSKSYTSGLFDFLH